MTNTKAYKAYTYQINLKNCTHRKQTVRLFTVEMTFASHDCDIVKLRQIKLQQ